MQNLTRFVFVPILVAALLSPLGQARAQAPCDPWSTLGSELNGDVLALTVYDDGSGPALYAGGGFTSAGGASANRIARWDGSSWSPLGSGLGGFGSVYALAVYDDGSGPALYVGGSFRTAGGASAHGIAYWNGNWWSSPYVFADFDSLYITGLRTIGTGPESKLLISGTVSGCELESYGSSSVRCDRSGIVALHSHGGVGDLGYDVAGPVTAMESLPEALGGGVVVATWRDLSRWSPQCPTPYLAGNVDVWSEAVAGGGWDDPRETFLVQPRRTDRSGLTSSGFGDDRASGSWGVDIEVLRSETEAVVRLSSFASGEVRATGTYGPSRLQLTIDDMRVLILIDEPLYFDLETEAEGIGVRFTRLGGGPVVGRRLLPGTYVLWPDGIYGVDISTELGQVTAAVRLNAELILSRSPLHCLADCDGSGVLDFFDFLCFQQAFAAGDPLADCDGSGTIDFFDFLCFQSAFVAGCP